MFLQLAHTKLNVYKQSMMFALECYKITQHFPADEKFAMTSQIRRAAISVHLNIAEGCSRKSLGERKRYFEISRGSVIEIDAALDIANNLNYTNVEQMHDLGEAMLNTFKLLSGLINNNEL